MWECSEDRTLPRGTWYLWRTGKTRVLFSCPLCGQIMFFGPDDGVKIAPDGSVTPAIRCPAQECVFEYGVRLVGWKLEEPEQPPTD